MNTTAITAARISPDGSAAVIGTEAPDWKNNLFRSDLWLWTAAAGLKPLTHSGSEENPQWSPDGKWIAFLSDRELPGESADADGSASGSGEEDVKASRVWVIAVSGGEALPLYTENLDAHAFAWSTDGSAIYFSVTAPQTSEEKEAHKAEWKDVIRWREQHRGDVLVKQAVGPALAKAVENPAPESKKDKKKGEKKESEAAAELPKGAEVVAKSELEIGEIAPGPDGKAVAFVTGAPHHRVEKPADFEVFLADGKGGAKQLTHNNGLEEKLLWSADGKALYFMVGAGAGTVEGEYRDVQGRLYRLEVATGAVTRLGAEFEGSFEHFALLADGTELALGLKGTEQQAYRIDGAKAVKLPGLTGTYGEISAAKSGNAILVTHSTINEPMQAYMVADALNPDKVKALTAINPVFGERAKPEWQTYQWKSDDGKTVEGVLIYPPGKKGAKHLRMLTLVHGGPEDADGNRFEADWYDWAGLAAANGWLVFRPNYRGSTGYGDEFMLSIVPHVVSGPGRDILAGVDALVKDGIADPDRLAIGGYSYGGYMTNWLITQTTRFKAAVTGAGAVEHAANWGNDDLTFDDAWFLGGRPWEKPEIYQSEAALFRFDKVKTPTHVVQGGADVRVSYLEGVTLERALESLGIPHSFLVFPGEGHGLEKNPWHGYIKVREELKWLEKYDGR
ncbi:alpha/beta hydrolase family protein [Terracidiphilus gabretensis]|uniref:alpha/beta hydrolase family protein n=1 Tax=Terracidiphilus gabretensis TaxID=1577687 RepID=UPI00071BC9EE|nr:S9 family peptidase [Terracidiphilus gabretensis]